MARRDVEGTVYLLHFDQKLGNPDSKTGYAQHYSGWTENLPERLAEHAAGHGAKIMAAVKAAGIPFHVSRTWAGTRARERQLKNQGGASRRCPDCKEKGMDMEKPAQHEDFERQPTSDYNTAMAVPPGGRTPEDPRYALGDHAEELTGPLAQARMAYAKREVDDRELGA